MVNNQNSSWWHENCEFMRAVFFLICFKQRKLAHFTCVSSTGADGLAGRNGKCTFGVLIAFCIVFFLFVQLFSYGIRSKITNGLRMTVNSK